MPPKSRSSTPSTSTPKERSSETPTRKTPRCAQCQRPRAGHPRQGCPYAGSPTKQDILAAISDMNIADAKGEDKRIPRRSITPKKVAFAGEPSLESLSTRSSDVIRNILLTKGDDSSEDTETEETIQKWRYSIPNKYPHSGMPGTLVTPMSSLSSVGVAKQEPRTPEPLDSSPSRRPLGPTPSFQTREELLRFAKEESTTPPVSLYTLPLNTVSEFTQRAKLANLHVKYLPSEDGKNVPAIMGHNEQEVLRVFASMEARMQASPKAGARGGSGFAAAAGGAVVGAAATFAGLAYT
ncbi:hypothetical protein BDV98DRAFT_560991 [Pterulicium gracile]|uniref:Uncharacterized protein n=1 Tax=Pterulicium gracile TaxID=1884261 RepID=A0A5C3QZN0_9AGAR|nr:hypothetical protein BDV98DRAFT_560991 [Pterula gracilis]